MKYVIAFFFLYVLMVVIGLQIGDRPEVKNKIQSKAAVKDLPYCEEVPESVDKFMKQAGVSPICKERP